MDTDANLYNLDDINNNDNAVNGSYYKCAARTDDHSNDNHPDPKHSECLRPDNHNERARNPDLAGITADDYIQSVPVFGL